MIALPKTMARMAALILAGLFGAVGLIGVAAPILDHIEDTKTSLEDVTALEIRLQQRLSALEQDAQHLETLSVPNLARRGARDGEIDATLQAEIGRLARNAGVRLRSVTSTGEQTFSGHPALGLRVELESPLDRLLSFLLAIERSEPPIIPTRTTLRRLGRRGGNEPQPLVYLRLELAAPIAITTAEPTQ